MDPDIERLRQDLHLLVDDLFVGLKWPIPESQLALKMASRLMLRATANVDREVGEAFGTGRQLTDEEAAELGQKIRLVVQKALDGSGPRLLDEVAAEGLAGALVTVRFLASESCDPYLLGLAQALDALRYGHEHAWLTPADPKVHPRRYARIVLEARAVPWATIEYLHASGAYDSKTAAQQAVVERLDIAEDTLRDWRKQQLRLHRADFKLKREMYRFVGSNVRGSRERESQDAEAAKVVRQRDEQFGLAALDTIAVVLRELGADRGKKQ